MRASTNPGTLRRAIAVAEQFEELAVDVASAKTRLSTLESRVEDRVQLAISARDLDAVVALLCEVDGWQVGGSGPVSSWIARLNEAAASMLDESDQ